MVNGPRSPLFTVLMPTHNRADVLPFAIRSVLNQTVEDFELLVVGDGCTDGTAQVMAQITDPRVTWLDLPKAPGFGYANRNIALGQARGALFAFAAHDDLYLPDHLERMARMFEIDSVQWAYSRPLWVRDDGVVVPFFGNVAFGAAARHFRVANTIPAGCVVYRRNLHDSAGGWPADIAKGGDWHMWQTMLDGLPPTAMRFVREPTQLHFRANWRDTGRWAPRPLAYLSAMADSSLSWPKVLKLGPIPEGEAPQKRVLDRILADGHGVSGAIRNGVNMLMDDIAFTHTVGQPFDVVL